MRGLGLLAAAACGLAVAAPIPKEKEKPKKDEDVIQGTWAMEKFDGGQAPPAGLGPIRMTFITVISITQTQNAQNDVGLTLSSFTRNRSSARRSRPGCRLWFRGRAAGTRSVP